MMLIISACELRDPGINRCSTLIQTRSITRTHWPQFHRKSVSVYTSFQVLLEKDFFNEKMKGTSSQISRRNLFRMTAGALGSSSSGGKNRNFKILFLRFKKILLIWIIFSLYRAFIYWHKGSGYPSYQRNDKAGRPDCCSFTNWNAGFIEGIRYTITDLIVYSSFILNEITFVSSYLQFGELSDEL